MRQICNPLMLIISVGCIMNLYVQLFVFFFLANVHISLDA